MSVCLNMLREGGMLCLQYDIQENCSKQWIWSETKREKRKERKKCYASIRNITDTHNVCVLQVLDTDTFQTHLGSIFRFVNEMRERKKETHHIRPLDTHHQMMHSFSHNLFFHSISFPPLFLMMVAVESSSTMMINTMTTKRHDDHKNDEDDWGRWPRKSWRWRGYLPICFEDKPSQRGDMKNFEAPNILIRECLETLGGKLKETTSYQKI